MSASDTPRSIRDDTTKRFYEQLNEAVERTRADPEAWADYQAEVALFDNAAADGLGTDDIPDHGGGPPACGAARRPATFAAKSAGRTA